MLSKVNLLDFFYFDPNNCGLNLKKDGHVHPIAVDLGWSVDGFFQNRSCIKLLVGYIICHLSFSYPPTPSTPHLTLWKILKKSLGFQNGFGKIEFSLISPQPQLRKFNLLPSPLLSLQYQGSSIVILDVVMEGQTKINNVWLGWKFIGSGKDNDCTRLTLSIIKK